MRPACAFVIQNMAGERFKKHTKNKHQKSQKTCQRGSQKGRPQKCFFLVFLRSVAKGAPEWSQGPPGAPSPRSSCIENCIKMVRQIVFL